MSVAKDRRHERRSGGGRDTRPARFAHFVSLSWPFRPFGPGTGPGEWRVSLRSSLTRPCLPPPRRETRRPPAPYPALTPPAFSLRSRTAGGGPGSWSLPTVVLLAGAARPYHHHHRAFAGPPSEPAHSLRLRSHYRSIFVSLIPRHVVHPFPSRTVTRRRQEPRRGATRSRRIRDECSEKGKAIA